MNLTGNRPRWLTFDCYGTLVQWDEGLITAIKQILIDKYKSVDLNRFMSIYEQNEYEQTQVKPYRSFRAVTAKALELTMQSFSLEFESSDADGLVSSISRMPPFPGVVATLQTLKSSGFQLAIISNTDDETIAGNVSQLGGTIDRVVTAQQAKAYKPSHRLFEYAWRSLGIEKDEAVHICTSPRFDLVPARDLQCRCIWIDRGTGRRVPSGYDPNAIVARLSQIPELLVAVGWTSEVVRT